MSAAAGNCAICDGAISVHGCIQKPGFTDQYTEYALEQVRKSGATPEVIAATEREIREFRVQYDKLWVNAAYTFMEPFPVGLLVTVISAAVLRKKRADFPVPSSARAS